MQAFSLLWRRRSACYVRAIAAVAGRSATEALVVCMKMCNARTCSAWMSCTPDLGHGVDAPLRRNCGKKPALHLVSSCSAVPRSSPPMLARGASRPAARCPTGARPAARRAAVAPAAPKVRRIPRKAPLTIMWLCLLQVSCVSWKHLHGPRYSLCFNLAHQLAQVHRSTLSLCDRLAHPLLQVPTRSFGASRVARDANGPHKATPQSIQRSLDRGTCCPSSYKSAHTVS